MPSLLQKCLNIFQDHESKNGFLLYILCKRVLPSTYLECYSAVGARAKGSKYIADLKKVLGDKVPLQTAAVRALATAEGLIAGKTLCDQMRRLSGKHFQFFWPIFSGGSFILVVRDDFARDNAPTLRRAMFARCVDCEAGAFNTILNGGRSGSKAITLVVEPPKGSAWAPRARAESKIPLPCKLSAEAFADVRKTLIGEEYTWRGQKCRIVDVSSEALSYA
jgi:hypothetical protein